MEEVSFGSPPSITQEWAINVIAKSTGSNFYIDVHAHVFPNVHEDALREADKNDIDGWKSPEWSVASTLKAMDDCRARAQVLSMSSPGIDFFGGETAGCLNEFLVRLVQEHSARFGSLAIPPPPDVEACLAETGVASTELVEI